MSTIVRGQVNVTFESTMLRSVAPAVSGFALKETGGTTGAVTAGTGSYLHEIIALPMSLAASAGFCNILLADGPGGTVEIFGTLVAGTATSGLGTYVIPLGVVSRFGPWRVTTQGGVRVTAVGKFL